MFRSTKTETRTFIDSDGTRRTETTTSTNGSGGGGSIGFEGFTSKIGGFTNKAAEFSDSINKGVQSLNMNFFGGGKPVSRQRHAPLESRYSRGWGSGGSSRRRNVEPMKLEGKTYDEIKKECLAAGRLFEDPDFPAVDQSIFYSRKPPRPFTWKRPPELVSNAQLFVEGASRFDVKQGELGDCWLLAAVACLCGDKKLLYRVVPPDQSFTDGYAGIFHFQFWRYGEWTDVIVDDRLPTFYDKLVFMHSAENNEFWTALLEKAYAKLMGSYEALKGGATSEAMEDFTGGVTEMYDMRTNLPQNLFTIMHKAFERNSLMGCSIEALPGKMEAELDNGLIMGHAYSITSVKLVEIQTSRTKGKIPMVRIRNPWGNECEWKGAWSDKSNEWKFISEEERRDIGLTFSDDGEFWMSFSDFTKNFQKIEICHLGPEGAEETDSKKRWNTNCIHGGWKRRVNAGGCRNYLETFWSNPQYQVEVLDADDDDDENCGTLIVGAMQKDRRKGRKEGLDMLTMGYAIYKMKEGEQGPLDMRFFKYNASVAKSPAFINLREVCGRHRLEPGQYCIIPSTFEPNQEGDFLLRIFSEKKSNSEEMDEETSMADVKPEAPASDEDNRQDQEMRETFKKVAGVDLEIDAYELKDIVNAAFMREFKFEGFSSETCRSMVAMMDEDKSGKLGFEEFKKLWNDLRLWKSVFKQFDADRSGNFNSYELRRAFHAVGFRVSNSTFNGLVQRYSYKDGKIYFDDFIHCVVRMKTMFETFKEMKKPSGKAEFSMDEFIQTTMYS